MNGSYSIQLRVLTSRLHQRLLTKSEQAADSSCCSDFRFSKAPTLLINKIRSILLHSRRVHLQGLLRCRIARKSQSHGTRLIYRLLKLHRISTAIEKGLHTVHRCKLTLVYILVTKKHFKGFFPATRVITRTSLVITTRQQKSNAGEYSCAI